MTETIVLTEESTQPQRVEIAPAALFVAMIGFFTTGVGMIWNWATPSASSYLWLEVAGPVLIAGAMLFHIRKIGERIGRFAVTADFKCKTNVVGTLTTVAPAGDSAARS